MALRLTRLRDELVTDKPGSDFFRRIWNAVMDRIEGNETAIRSDLAALEESLSDTIVDMPTQYMRCDGTLAASAATATHKLAWTHPTTGAVYYILLSNA